MRCRLALVGLVFALAPAAALAQVQNYSDHLRTGFPLTGSHERVACESCHVRGIFEGTPRQCGTCHSGGGLWQASRKNANHIPSSDLCGDCHITTSWSVARFDHSQVTGGCVRCHNGSVATGKPVHHVPSSEDCELCHGTIAWVPAEFDHSMVTGSCFSCHNGTFARGKSRGHPPSSNDCELCHTTSSWEGAGFDHTGITGGCGGCHDGSQATGKPGNHLVTALECNVCHSTAGWRPANFTHTSPNYPGDHAAPLDCGDCHIGSGPAVNWRSPGYQPDCAGCHAGDFKPGPHKKVDSPRILYTVDELRDCTGACHQYTDATFNTIDKARSGEHRVNRGGW